MNNANIITTVHAALNVSRLRMIPQSGWNPNCTYVPIADLSGRVFWTDGNGDGLYTFGPQAPDMQQLFAVRDFSLHKYDLSTDAGRRQAREYLRRKLSKL